MCYWQNERVDEGKLQIYGIKHLRENDRLLDGDRISCDRNIEKVNIGSDSIHISDP